MRELKFKRKNHICSMKGCGNRITTMFCKSEDPTGCHYFCDNCVKDMYEAIYKVAKENVSSETTSNDTDKPESTHTNNSDASTSNDTDKHNTSQNTKKEGHK